MTLSVSYPGGEPRAASPDPLSDNTPLRIEEVSGFSGFDGHCDNGLAAGAKGPRFRVCPSCAVDRCNVGCDTTTGRCTPQQVSTPCPESDGNLCTAARLFPARLVQCDHGGLRRTTSISAWYVGPARRPTRWGACTRPPAVTWMRKAGTRG